MKPGCKRTWRISGASDWQSDAPGDVELLSEVMARSCYRSFGTALNPNVTRVRGSNKAHLANLIKVKHGSTLEHAWLNFMFCRREPGGHA